MPGFTGFVAILFSFNCQRRDFTTANLTAFFLFRQYPPHRPAQHGRLTVESRKNLYRAY